MVQSVLQENLALITAALTAPSYIALLGWLIIGLIFFVIRYPKLKNMDNDELSRLHPSNAI
jgi:hypothetical protein